MTLLENTHCELVPSQVCEGYDMSKGSQALDSSSLWALLLLARVKVHPHQYISNFIHDFRDKIYIINILNTLILEEILLDSCVYPLIFSLIISVRDILSLILGHP